MEYLLIQPLRQHIHNLLKTMYFKDCTGMALISQDVFHTYATGVAIEPELDNNPESFYSPNTANRRPANRKNRRLG